MLTGVNGDASLDDGGAPAADPLTHPPIHRLADVTGAWNSTPCAPKGLVWLTSHVPTRPKVVRHVSSICRGQRRRLNTAVLGVRLSFPPVLFIEICYRAAPDVKVPRRHGVLHRRNLAHRFISPEDKSS